MKASTIVEGQSRERDMVTLVEGMEGVRIPRRLVEVFQFVVLIVALIRPSNQLMVEA